MSVNNVSKYIIKPTKMRKFVTHLNKAGVLLPVILLESTVTGGRTYQAYKRGGYTEARERLCEESIGAVFWLSGVKAFNAIGNKIGQKYLHIEDPTFSLAKDNVRTPFENMIRDKNLEKAKKFLVGFKFTKIALSVIMAAGLLGFVVPKINQHITRRLLHRDNLKQEKKNNTAEVQQPQDNLIYPKKVNTSSFWGLSMEQFVNRTKPVAPAFGSVLSIDKLAMLTNNLENHDIYKLLATDSGVLAGRTYNARNKDEKIEILIRDAGSIYFYLRCKDDVINFLRKRDGFGGKLSALDPTSAMYTHNAIVKRLARYEKVINGKIDIPMFERLVKGSDPKLVEETLNKFEFKNKEVIAFKDFVDKAKSLDINLNGKLMKKAKEFAKFQPERNLSDLGYNEIGRVLTKQQVKDILSNSFFSRPNFLKGIMQEKFENNLAEPYKFIPSKTIEQFRTDVDNYVNSILEYAKKYNFKEVTPELLMKVNKANFTKNAVHIVSGLGVAALFLSTIIPKIQYFVTKMRTGSNSFPGVRDIQ